MSEPERALWWAAAHWAEAYLFYAASLVAWVWLLTAPEKS